MERIILVGASGLVGQTLQSLLTPEETRCLRAPSRPTADDFADCDMAFFCTPPPVSQELVPIALKAGAAVIDVSSAFRFHPQSVLFHPAIALRMPATRLFSIPNCVVAIMLSVLAPLHQSHTIKRLLVTTYQAASGAGRKGLNELVDGELPSVFPHPYSYNLFLHEKSDEEEKKIIQETKLLLNMPDLPIHARSVRVPVKRAHAMSLNVSFERAITPEKAHHILNQAPGVAFSSSPTPLQAEHQNDIFYGPIRSDPTLPSTLDIWVCGDQLLRGAALTAYECFQKLQLCNCF